METRFIKHFMTNYLNKNAYVNHKDISQYNAMSIFSQEVSDKYPMSIKEVSSPTRAHVLVYKFPCFLALNSTSLTPTLSIWQQKFQFLVHTIWECNFCSVMK